MKLKTSLVTVLGVMAGLSLWLIMLYNAPINIGEFDIILNKGDVKVVSGSDILSYNVTSHALTLTGSCAERLKAMKMSLAGEFSLVVNGKVELSGILVPPIVSRSYPSSQVVIVYPTFESSYTTMKFQMGYPWDRPGTIDPRENPVVTQFFENADKLIR